MFNFLFWEDFYELLNLAKPLLNLSNFLPIGLYLGGGRWNIEGLVERWDHFLQKFLLGFLQKVEKLVFGVDQFVVPLVDWVDDEMVLLEDGVVFRVLKNLLWKALIEIAVHLYELLKIWVVFLKAFQEGDLVLVQDETGNFVSDGQKLVKKLLQTDEFFEHRQLLLIFEEVLIVDIPVDEA